MDIGASESIRELDDLFDLHLGLLTLHVRLEVAQHLVEVLFVSKVNVGLTSSL